MPSPYNDLRRITDPQTFDEQRILAMRSFADELNWTPSYEISDTFGVEAVTGHIFVEHGLDNAAAISFLKTPYRSADLSFTELRALLAISYNNLVEWHLFVSGWDARWVNNLAETSKAPEADRIEPINRTNFLSMVSSSALDEISQSLSIRRTLQPCDEALLRTVSRWKLLLKADYPNINNRNLSALFNAIVLVRGCEDRSYHRDPDFARLLVGVTQQEAGSAVNLLQVFERCLKQTGIGGAVKDFIEEDALDPFSDIDVTTALNMFRDFYSPKDAPYDFNFGIMSKHALSRIYEKYVSILSEDESDQTEMGFARTLPKERGVQGSVYTPQFISSFFVRYLRENLSPKRFRGIKSIDPACGSGIFLRNLLELQCDPIASRITPSTIRVSFRNAEGIDRDVNACEAARLSLALLYLTVTGVLPKLKQISIKKADAVVERLAGRLKSDSYGAVISNPPYVKLDHLSQGDREIIRKYLGESYAGRLDAYIPFVKLCLEICAPGGMICLVLPQVFLTARNARTLRESISKRCNVKCLVDLSAVPVFEGLGTYTILLILQKRDPAIADGAPAQVAQITESVGPALQACLDGRRIRSDYYNVYPVSQDFFERVEWVLVSPDQMEVDRRISLLPKLSAFMTVAQGFVSGADDIFIRDTKEIAEEESKIYKNYLPDREIGRYNLPIRTNKVVFYPYLDDKALDEQTLVRDYPKTWAYLKLHQKKLMGRRSVQTGGTPWWRPVRPRSPVRLMRPKITMPHLMLTSRFAIDYLGKYAVSRAPFVICEEEGEADQRTLLNVFCAILNSTICNWYIRTYAPKYSRGYNRLEVSLLKSVPVPDLTTIDARTLTLIVDSVEEMGRLKDRKAREKTDRELDRVISRLYGFTRSEQEELFGID